MLCQSEGYQYNYREQQSGSDENGVADWFKNIHEQKLRKRINSVNNSNPESIGTQVGEVKGEDSPDTEGAKVTEEKGEIDKPVTGEHF